MVTQATDVTVTCFSLLTLATQARALATLALSTHSLHLAGDAAERQPQLDAEHGGSRKPVLSSRDLRIKSASCIKSRLENQVGLVRQVAT